MTLVRLLIHRYRLLIASWSVLLIALPAVTVWAYQSTYPTAEGRRIAVELAQQDVATTLLYGDLPDPGTPALMFVWETGAIATILTAIMAVLLAVALTRATEDDGTLELLRSCGIDPRAPLRSALAILCGVAAILAAGFTASTGLAVGRVDGVTWPGAAACGVVVGLTFLLTGVFAVVLAQVAPTAPGARALGFAGVGVAFATRAYADTQDVEALGWVSPLAVRATVRPFGENRWWVVAVYAAVIVALARLAGELAHRREYRAGLVRRRDLRTTRLDVRSGLGLATRLSRPSVVVWTVGVTCLTALFSAMGSGVVEQGRRGDLDGFLGSQLGTADPVAGYFAYSGTVVGIVVCTFAVLSVLHAKHDEIRGLTDHVLAAGSRRWAPLAWQAAVTATGSLVILAVAGILGATVAPLAVDGDDVAVRAFAYVVGQWPAVLALAGWAAFLTGIRPRLSWLAWAPLVASGALALLGELLGIPSWIRRLGVFQHVPDLAAPQPPVGGLAVLLAVAGVTVLLGIAGTTRRDVVLG
jgi:ABC-2 type transport system permease protein